MQDLVKGLYQTIALRTVSAEKLSTLVEPLKKEQEAILRRKHGFGVNRAEKKRIDKIIYAELNRLEKVINQHIKDDLKFLKFFDQWTSIETLNKEVDGIYNYLES